MHKAECSAFVYNERISIGKRGRERKQKMDTETPNEQEGRCPNALQALEPPVCDHAAFVRGALLLQERWALMIVFSLLAGPTGFSELMRRGSINTTTLTQRLNLLERAGLLVKTIHSTMPPRTSYRLTEAGEALEPILTAIGQWSEKYLPVVEAGQACPSKEACPSQEVCPNTRA